MCSQAACEESKASAALASSVDQSALNYLTHSSQIVWSSYHSTSMTCALADVTSIVEAAVLQQGLAQIIEIRVSAQQMNK